MAHSPPTSTPRRKAMLKHRATVLRTSNMKAKVAVNAALVTAMAVTAVTAVVNAPKVPHRKTVKQKRQKLCSMSLPRPRPLSPPLWSQWHRLQPRLWRLLWQ